MTGDLTTLAKLKVFLEIDATDTAADRSLAQLITSQSSIFLAETRRDILYQRYIETRDGEGTPGIEPRQYPVQRVESVLVDGNTIPQLPALVAGETPSYGWVIAKDRIEIRSAESRLPFVPDDGGSGAFGGLGFLADGGTGPCRFSRGPGNVVLTYWAGFLISGEAATIPASAPYEVQTAGNFYSDVAVTLADGTALTGPYTVSVTGLYTFAAADAGKGILLSYAYVPPDIEQAVHWMVEYHRQGKNHAGQKSKSAGQGETVYFETDAFPDRVQRVIDRHERKF